MLCMYFGFEIVFLGDLVSGKLFVSFLFFNIRKL